MAVSIQLGLVSVIYYWLFDLIVAILCLCSTNLCSLSIIWIIWYKTDRAGERRGEIDYLIKDTSWIADILNWQQKMVVQAPATILFSLFYMVFCTGEMECDTSCKKYLFAGFLCQFREFRGAGLSPEAFLSFGDWLGSEEIRWLRFLGRWSMFIWTFHLFF